MAVLITGATALLEGIDLSDYFTSDQIVITTEKLPSMPLCPDYRGQNNI